MKISLLTIVFATSPAIQKLMQNQQKSSRKGKLLQTLKINNNLQPSINLQS